MSDARSFPGPRSCAGWWSVRPVHRTQPVLLDAAWNSVHEVFGATIVRPAHLAELDDRGHATRGRSDHRSGERGRADRARDEPTRVAHHRLPRARPFGPESAGGDVTDDDDSPPLRADGRAARGIRWLDGVAVVTDGKSLCVPRGPEAARGVALPHSPARARDRRRAVRRRRARRRHRSHRPRRPRPLFARRRGGRRDRCLVVPMWTDRAPGAYRPLLEASLPETVGPTISTGRDPTGCARPSQPPRGCDFTGPDS